MYMATSKNRVLRPESYRDEWEDDDFVLQAEQEFANYLNWGWAKLNMSLLPIHCSE